MVGIGALGAKADSVVLDESRVLSCKYIVTFLSDVKARKEIYWILYVDFDGNSQQKELQT